MKKLVIKKSEIKDAVLISLLGRITFTETFGLFFKDKNDLLNYYEKTFSVQKIEKSMENPNNKYWIAFVDDLPVGYAKLKLESKSSFIESNNTCQLQKIYVLKDFISMKIGFELQNQLLNTARELGYKQIWLSVLNSNDRAINFYKKNEFEKIGSHDFQIGKENFDFIAMSKIL